MSIHKCIQCNTIKECYSSLNKINDIVDCWIYICKDCRDDNIKSNIENFNDDTSYTNEIICPHCGYVEDVSWEYADNNDRINCPECDNNFNYNRNIEVTYSTNK